MSRACEDDLFGMWQDKHAVVFAQQATHAAKRAAAAESPPQAVPPSVPALLTGSSDRHLLQMGPPDMPPPMLPPPLDMPGHPAAPPLPLPPPHPQHPQHPVMAEQVHQTALAYLLNGLLNPQHPVTVEQVRTSLSSAPFSHYVASHYLALPFRIP